MSVIESLSLSLLDDDEDCKEELSEGSVSDTTGRVANREDILHGLMADGVSFDLSSFSHDFNGSLVMLTFPRMEPRDGLRFLCNDASSA